ncbi:anti-sigma factor [Flavobacterium sp. SM2513]|uniref:anti-sigma factor n=1 Tax=Flavobacterium sp. SM2513 TaxID=3424766 RepID=UPI003D7FB323
MEVRAYIESGILELYVFGTLSESETAEVAEMAGKNPEVQEEIISIEKAVISLSYSMAPYLSAANYDRIREKLIEKHGKVVEMKPKSNVALFIGWAAAVVLMIGIGWQYTQLDSAKNQIATVETENDTLQKELIQTKLTQTQTESMLAVVRDQNNTVVPLGGQAVSPESKAKVYWNQGTQTVYVDASGLPQPPEGFVYQVWALKLNPLTPTSIGLLDDFKGNDSRLFAVNNAIEAEAFGITLEPAGGSISPTLEQLYTLGKV